MTPRMKNPSVIVEESMKPILALWGSVATIVPAKTLHLIHLRTSQINGCSFCCDSAVKAAKKDGDTDERLATVAAWRHTQSFSEAERAALALTESLTRIADSSDPVPDAIWNEAARTHDEKTLAALVLAISTVNVWNRCNVAVRQLPGAWT